jgi:hypothetical protein
MAASWLDIGMLLCMEMISAERRGCDVETKSGIYRHTSLDLHVHNLHVDVVTNNSNFTTCRMVLIPDYRCILILDISTWLTSY